MTRAKRMKPVQKLFDDTERRLALGLAAIERKVSDAETKLQELERYRGDYEKQFKQRAGRGIGATDLRDYQAFLARLVEAIRQQQQVVKRAQIERDAERQTLARRSETRQGARPRRREMADRRAARVGSTRTTRER